MRISHSFLIHVSIPSFSLSSLSLVFLTKWYQEPNQDPSVICDHGPEKLSHLSPHNPPHPRQQELEPMVHPDARDSWVSRGSRDCGGGIPGARRSSHHCRTHRLQGEQEAGLQGDVHPSSVRR